jgi:hypothetical protein
MKYAMTSRVGRDCRVYHERTSICVLVLRERIFSGLFFDKVMKARTMEQGHRLFLDRAASLCEITGRQETAKSTNELTSGLYILTIATENIYISKFLELGSGFRKTTFDIHASIIDECPLCYKRGK